MFTLQFTLELQANLEYGRIRIMTRSKIVLPPLQNDLEGFFLSHGVILLHNSLITTGELAKHFRMEGEMYI